MQPWQAIGLDSHGVIHPSIIEIVTFFFLKCGPLIHFRENLALYDSCSKVQSYFLGMALVLLCSYAENVIADHLNS